MSAYLRKYSHLAKADKFEITDRKREYFDIDTSSYMNYDFADLGHSHASHGPQPVSHKNHISIAQFSYTF